MLKQLTIHNFAIIENIDIKFDNGLTILLGETGAGKSLIIDSLSLLLGERASTELIRNGEDKATIKGVFSINNIHLSSLLNKLGIIILDDEIIIGRIISNSKSYIKVNGVNITLSDLKDIAKAMKKELERNMSDLQLKAIFEVRFNDVNKEDDYQGNIYFENGLDIINFYIETNIGEGMKPLGDFLPHL